MNVWYVTGTRDGLIVTAALSGVRCEVWGVRCEVCWCCVAPSDWAALSVVVTCSCCSDHVSSRLPRVLAIRGNSTQKLQNKLKIKRDLKNNSHLLESLQKMKIDQANNAIVIYIVRWEPTQCLKPYIQRATLLLRSPKQRNSIRCRKYLNINIMRIWRSCKCNEILLGGEKLTNLTYS